MLCSTCFCASHIIFAISQLLNLNELVKILVQFTARFFTLREVGLIYECCAKLAFLMVRHGNGPDKVTFSMMQRPSKHVCGRWLYPVHIWTFFGWLAIWASKRRHSSWRKPSLRMLVLVSESNWADQTRRHSHIHDAKLDHTNTFIQANQSYSRCTSSI